MLYRRDAHICRICPVLSTLSYLTHGYATADCICFLPRAISAHPARTNAKVAIRFAGYYAKTLN